MSAVERRRRSVCRAATLMVVGAMALAAILMVGGATREIRVQAASSQVTVLSLLKKCQPSDLPTSCFSADPAKNTFRKAMTPNTSYYLQRGTRFSKGSPISCAFHIFLGSAEPDAVNADEVGVVRAGGSGFFADDPVAGTVFAVQSGYALASGRAPVLFGRRVRAASDGTQFAIEIDGNIERVYVIDGTKPVRVEVTKDDGSIVVQKVVAGQFVSFDSGSEVLSAPAASSTTDKSRYFACHMKAIVTQVGVFPDPPVRVAEASPKGSITERFHALMTE